jgi:hypothetical protein
MTTFEFRGVVSAQIQAGETVTISVTKPDSTIDTLTATTLADRTYSVVKEYLVAGNYSVKAAVAADAAYQGATSNSVPFTVSLATRTITLTVNLV